MRSNLATDYDIETADEFLTMPQSLTLGAFEHPPYWDILTVIDPVADLDPADPIPSDKLARFEAHVAAALVSCL